MINADCTLRYLEQMPLVTPDQLVVEKTPSYFYSEVAPPRIHALNPGMKLLLTVRDPVERLASKMAMEYTRGNIHGSVESLLTVPGVRIPKGKMTK